jgi:hypothetical protein
MHGQRRGGSKMGCSSCVWLCAAGTAYRSRSQARAVKLSHTVSGRHRHRGILAALILACLRIPHHFRSRCRISCVTTDLINRRNGIKTSANIG